MAPSTVSAPGQSHGAGELPAATLDWLARAQPGRVVVVAEVGALAKDAKRLAGAGYRPVAFQPVDVEAQGFEVEVVGVWSGTKKIKPRFC